jgi:hypothetical protein
LKDADKALNGLLHDSALLQSLSDQTLKYIPPTTGQVISTLWALTNVNSTDSISKLDLQKAVHNAGGSVGESEALWEYLNPENTQTISAKQFIGASYLNAATTANLNAETDAVELKRIQATTVGSVSNILNIYSGAAPVQGNSSVNIFI